MTENPKKDATEGSPSTAAAASRGDEPSAQAKFGLVMGLLGVFFFLIYLLLVFWPGDESSVEFWGIRVDGDQDEVRWLVLVMVAGALGSFIHAANSAGDFIGNQKFKARWVYWYLLRLPVGASMALMFFLLLRGGILTGTPAWESGKPPYGIVGLSALAGMFAKNASNKLGEVFETLFRSNKDGQLADKMTNGELSIESIEPNPVFAAGTKSAEVHIQGRGFLPSTRVRLGDKLLEPTLLSPNNLSLTLGAETLDGVRDLTLSLENVDAAHSRSTGYTLSIRPPRTPGGADAPDGPAAPRA